MNDDLPPEWEQNQVGREMPPPNRGEFDDLIGWTLAVFAMLAGTAILAWVAVAAVRLVLEVIG